MAVCRVCKDHTPPSPAHARDAPRPRPHTLQHASPAGKARTVHAPQRAAPRGVLGGQEVLLGGHAARPGAQRAGLLPGRHHLVGAVLHAAQHDQIIRRHHHACSSHTQGDGRLGAAVVRPPACSAEPPPPGLRL